METLIDNPIILENTQKEMRQSYLGGGPAMLVSGVMWLIAAIVSWVGSPMNAVVTLFIGGAMIFPLGAGLTRLLGYPGHTSKSNPLATMALETTVLLFIGFFLAFASFQVRANWFFPTMLMMIGGRYVLFATLYGMRLYWILGLILVLAGGGLLTSDAPFIAGALIGAAIEISFSAIVMSRVKRIEAH